MESFTGELHDEYKKHTENNEAYSEENVDESIIATLSKLNENILVLKKQSEDNQSIQNILSNLRLQLAGLEKPLLDEEVGNDSQVQMILENLSGLIGEGGTNSIIKQNVAQILLQQGVMNEKGQFDEKTFSLLSDSNKEKVISSLFLIKEQLDPAMQKRLEQIQKEVAKEIKDISQEVNTDDFLSQLSEFANSSPIVKEMIEEINKLSTAEKAILIAGIIALLAAGWLAFPIIASTLATTYGAIGVQTLNFITKLEKLPLLHGSVTGILSASTNSGVFSNLSKNFGRLFKTTETAVKIANMPGGMSAIRGIGSQ